VLRGGSWADGSFFLRSSYRLVVTPGNTFSGFGFRVARAP
jgi:formylglycine-generating enzyme required for sulfatase activity